MDYIFPQLPYAAVISTMNPMHVKKINLHQVCYTFNINMGCSAYKNEPNAHANLAYCIKHIS